MTGRFSGMLCFGELEIDVMIGGAGNFRLLRDWLGFRIGRHRGSTGRLRPCSRRRSTEVPWRMSAWSFGSL